MGKHSSFPDKFHSRLTVKGIGSELKHILIPFLQVLQSTMPLEAVFLGQKLNFREIEATDLFFDIIKQR